MRNKFSFCWDDLANRSNLLFIQYYFAFSEVGLRNICIVDRKGYH